MTLTDLLPAPTPATNGVSAAERGKLELAQLLGEDAAKIKNVDPSWVQMLTEGYLADLHIGWPRFETKMRHEDIGMHPRSEKERAAWNQLIRLGKRNLRPDSLLRRIARAENQWRKAHELRTYKTGWKGRFIATGKDGRRYLAWKEEMQRHAADFYKLRDEVCGERWDKDQDWLVAQYTVLGYENYARLQQVPAARRAELRLELPDDAEAWVKEFVVRMMRTVPSKREAYAAFSYEIELAYVPLIGMMAEDQLAARKVALERETVVEEARALAEARTAAERDYLAQKSRDKAQLFTDFMADVSSQVRGLVYDVCVDCLEALKRNHGELPPANHKALRTLIEKMELLNTDTINDPELDREVAVIRAMLLAKPTSTDATTPTAILQQIGAEARLALLQLDRRPKRSARDLGIPDAAPALLATLATQRQRRARAIGSPLPTTAAALPARQQRASRQVAAVA